MTLVNTIPIEAELLLHQPDWTVEQYEAMVAAGVLGDEDRVELLFGKIVEQMPIGTRHSFCVQELAYFMIRRFGVRFVGRQEQPVLLLGHSVPEPDYVLATLHPHRYANSKPGAEDIQLVVEVADATLGRDQTSKARLYGQAGINEYWIINLIDNRIEVYTEPDRTTGGYTSVKLYEKGTSLASPLLGELAVNDLIP